MESLSVPTKKFLYIGLFTVLGVMTSFILRGGLEYLAIDLLVDNFSYYNLGLSWDQWFDVHTIGSILLPILFGFFGYHHGQHAWEDVYGDLEA